MKVKARVRGELGERAGLTSPDQVTQCGHGASVTMSVPPSTTTVSASRLCSSSRQLPPLCMRRWCRSARSACMSVSWMPRGQVSPRARAASMRFTAAASSLARRRACAHTGLEALMSV